MGNFMNICIKSQQLEEKQPAMEHQVYGTGMDILGYPAHGELTQKRRISILSEHKNSKIFKNSRFKMFTISKNGPFCLLKISTKFYKKSLKISQKKRVKRMAILTGLPKLLLTGIASETWSTAMRS